MAFSFRKKMKNFEVLNFEEKKKFVDTLLIIGSIIVVLNIKNYLIPYLIFFIVSSLVFLVWLSTLQRAGYERRSNRSTRILNAFFSSVLTFSFSSIIASLSVPTIVDLMDIINMIAVYLSVGFFLFYVLVLYKNDIDNCDIDIVD
jgi:hypothetical protein